MKLAKKDKLLSVLRRLFISVWLFPAVLVTGLLLLTALRISGSSIGVYSTINGGKDPGMIIGSPRGVRSDEWLVNTQMAVAESQNHFKCLNRNIGNGQDVSLMGDVPCKDWSSVFKPQNLVFFVLPLEHAFAFKWWSLGISLTLAAYLLSLEIFPRNTLRAVLIAALVGLTPMIFWWYSSGIILCVTYSLLAVWLAIRILKSKGTKAGIGFGLLLAYIISCFALILYPPFQIPCAMAAAVFFLGYSLDSGFWKRKADALRSLGYIFAALIIAGLVALAFLKTRASAVNLVTHTVYPGARVELSGGVDPLKSFSSFLSPNLEYDSKAASGYLVNQSEASNFIFIAPYLFLPSIYIVARQWQRRGKLLWGLILTDAIIVFFLVRMYISTPWLEPFYRLFLLNKVSSTRLLIGAGLAGVFQLQLIMKVLEKSVLKPFELRMMAIFGGFTGLVSMLLIGAYTIRHFPVFIQSYPKVLLFSLWLAAGIFLILYRRFILGLVLLVAFSLLSVYRIHPLYRGLAPLTTSPTIKTIESYPKDGKWVVLDDRSLINFPIMAGRPSLDSVQFYPQISLWAQLDKTKMYENVYNRYAHVVFSDDSQLATTFTLKYNDLIYVKFEPCGSFIQKNDIYVLSPNKLPPDCLALKQAIDLPARQLFIYQIVPPAKT